MLKKLRAEKNVTVGQISGKTGIPYDILSRLETGKEKDIAPSTVSLLAQYFGVQIDELIGFSPVERYLVTGGRKIDLTDYSESELTEIENFMTYLRWRRAEEKKEREHDEEERKRLRMERQTGKPVDPVENLINMIEERFSNKIPPFIPFKDK
ncbi:MULTISPECIES: helix-turn-helix domain-containing protein [Paenibacillus]|nr:helix-turn-helix transcriptional regulator [Paenibacillus odorifer]